MTAKPVRDLLYSKSRGQKLLTPPRLDSIREIEIEHIPNNEFEKMRLPVDMAELNVLNERSSDRQDNFTAEEKISTTTQTGQANLGRPGSTT